MFDKLDEIINEDALEEAVPTNFNEFTRVRHQSNFSADIEKVAFYKLIMSLSNLHLAASDYYVLNDDTRMAKRHFDYATRMRNDANRIKNA